VVAWVGPLHREVAWEAHRHREAWVGPLHREVLLEAADCSVAWAVVE